MSTCQLLAAFIERGRIMERLRPSPPSLPFQTISSAETSTHTGPHPCPTHTAHSIRCGCGIEDPAGSPCSGIQELTPSVGGSNLISASMPDLAPEELLLSIGAHMPPAPVGACEASMPSAVTTLSAIRNPTDTALFNAMQGLPLQWHSLYYSSPELDEVRTRDMVDAQFLPLFAVEPPGIGVEPYLKRLMGTFKCSPECFLYALCLIHRVGRRTPSEGAIREPPAHVVPVTTRSIHRLLLAAVVISAKMRDDRYFGMSFYAQMGGVTREDLLSMEVAMLRLLDFDASVRTEHFVDMIYSLRQFCSTLMHVEGAEWAGKAWADLLRHTTVPSIDSLRREMVAEVDEEHRAFTAEARRRCHVRLRKGSSTRSASPATTEDTTVNKKQKHVDPIE